MTPPAKPDAARPDTARPDPDILCIGSVLWDVIGRCDAAMPHGADRPGRIREVPGGVALNVARTLAALGLRPAVLSVLGCDRAGDALLTACAECGVEAGFVLRRADLPTDRYMAVEDANGLVAAIADAYSLEAAGDAILAPLSDGRLGRVDAPFGGMIALDGNLSEHLLAEIAASPLFAAADLRLAPASPGKALRLDPFVAAGRGTLYVNLEEAGLLCGATFDTAHDAAQGLVAAGARRALVTAGGAACADHCRAEQHSALPPPVPLARITGAGDTFMAAHLAAERQGAPRAEALAAAAQAAARFVSGKDVS